MSYDQKAIQDYDRAFRTAFWRKILSRITGKNYALLPYDEVRRRIQARGQHYIGFQQVRIDHIVGSQGRYKDFDRAFLPLQNQTRSRWIRLYKAQYRDEILPPVDLYKIGDIYFVKDGNHRISVARERGQVYIDAYVTEIDFPAPLTPDIQMEDLDVKEEQAEFLLQTQLANQCTDVTIETRTKGVYKELLEHIADHQCYLSSERKESVSFQEAAVSWYNGTYLPIIETIRQHRELMDLPGAAEPDLYLWIKKYLSLLTQIKPADGGQNIDGEEKVWQRVNDGKDRLSSQEEEELYSSYHSAGIKRMVRLLPQISFLEHLLVNQEKAKFLEKTRLAEFHPDARIDGTIPVLYEKLFEHIETHRWYMGEKSKSEIPYQQAVLSWYDSVYLPVVNVIREQDILRLFPGRTEADLYLWIIDHQWYLQKRYGVKISFSKAAKRFVEHHSPRLATRIFFFFRKWVKRLTGIELYRDEIFLRN